MNSILLLLFFFVGLHWFAKQWSSSDFAKFVFALIISPFLICLLGVALRLWQQEMPASSWLSGLGLFVFLGALLSYFLPPKLRHLALQHLLAVLAFLLTFPLRLLWRMGRLLLTRERITPEVLDPHRPIVGHRPPLVATKRTGREEAEG